MTDLSAMIQMAKHLEAQTVRRRASLRPDTITATQTPASATLPSGQSNFRGPLQGTAGALRGCLGNNTSRAPRLGIWGITIGAVVFCQQRRV